MNSNPPVVVDLDRALLRSSPKDEALIATLPHPTRFARAVWRRIARREPTSRSSAAVDVGLLPVNEALVAFIREQSDRGRRVLLITETEENLARSFVERFPEFDGYLAIGTGPEPGERRAARLTKEFGERGFDYVGGDASDRPVWRRAERSHLARRSPSSETLPTWASDVSFDSVITESRPARWRAWLRQVRLHQSAKNVLLLLPLLAAHRFDDIGLIFMVGAGFLSFSLFAASVYIVNDLVDLRSDRLHATKSRRPLAAGDIRSDHAVGAALSLAIAGLGIAVAIGPAFTVVLLCYAALTLTYSFWLKRVAIVDVLLLAFLYMVRIFAGAVIAGVSLSFWFVAVTMFLFLSLALVKRYAELASSAADERQAIPGRGYRRADAGIVLPLGVGAGVAVLLLLANYVQSDAIAALYPSGPLLWLAVPVGFYWIGNIWMQAARGAMHEDPVIFALRNPASLISGGAIVLLFAAASTPLLAWLSSLLASMSWPTR